MGRENLPAYWQFVDKLERPSINTCEAAPQKAYSAEGERALLDSMGWKVSSEVWIIRGSSASQIGDSSELEGHRLPEKSAAEAAGSFVRGSRVCELLAADVDGDAIALLSRISGNSRKPARK